MGRNRRWRLLARSASAALLAVIQPSVAVATPKQPNIVVIVADDLGYSDIGAYGGEISTPNIDQLASGGAQFSQFYAAPTCSPTRAMLLTGRDNHEVGLGAMAEGLSPQQVGRPGYEGFLVKGATTFAELLRQKGYSTFMAGKWHLGLGDDQSPASVGFERSFALLNGAHNHFGADQSGAYVTSHGGAIYRENGVTVRFPPGHYSSDYFADRFIDYIEASDPGRPFLGYLAFTAPHWPLQAPKEKIAKYHGKYDLGPRALWTSRVQRMRELGLINPGQQLEMPDFSQWDQLSSEDKAIESRKMEVYAAMVEQMDANIGRVLSALKATGRFDNTIIFFMSDNGAEGTRLVAPIHVGKPGEHIATAFDNSLDAIGSAQSFVSYGPLWATVSAAPFRGRKGFQFEGGVRVPAILFGTGSAGCVIGQIAHVTDVAPSIYRWAGTAGGSGARGQPLPTCAKSTDIAQTASAERELDGELFFQKSIRLGRYKAIHPVNVLPVLGGSPAQAKASWQLYDIDKDPQEHHDLAKKRPKILKGLIDRWRLYARRVGVVPYDAEDTQ